MFRTTWEKSGKEAEKMEKQLQQASEEIAARDMRWLRPKKTWNFLRKGAFIFYYSKQVEYDPTRTL